MSASRGDPSPNTKHAGSDSKLLLVEDDQAAAEEMIFRLCNEGYTVDLADTAAKAEKLGVSGVHDIIIMDFYLPDGNGEEVCRKLRAAGIDTPVLMLTGRAEIAEKISAFKQGADDYVTKPFAIEELLVRLLALRKRGRTKEAEHITVGSLTLERQSRTVRCGGVTTELSPLEYDLLAFLIENTGRAVTRDEIMAEVWDHNSIQETSGEEISTNTVDVYIRYLRKKIWGGKENSPIRTLRKIGYIFRE